MSGFQIMMLCVVAGIAWTSRHNWRGLLWIVVLMIDYMSSSAYWNANGPQPELVSGMLDASVCILILWLGRKQWENLLALIFLVMLGINLGYLAHNLAGLSFFPHNVQSTALEVMNILALASIGGVSSSIESDALDGWALRPRRPFLRFVRALVGADKKRAGD